MLASHTEAVLEPVDSNDALSSEQGSTGHGKLPDRPGTPNRHDVSGFDIAHLSAHVTGGQYVREKEHLLVCQAVFNLERANVGKRYADVFRLTAREPAKHMRIPEDPGGRKAPYLFRHPGIWI